MNQKRRIVLAEDSTILREGLRSLLASAPNLEIVGEAEDGLEAIDCVTRERPDLVVMDLSMPRMNGISAILEIKKQCPRTRILVLTAHSEEEYVFETLRAGTDGYVLKESTHGELVMAIESVLKGNRFISPGISSKIIEGYLNRGRTLRTGSPLELLSARERQIIKLVSEGYTNKRIADYLSISPNTVDKHRANLMKKLNLHNASEITSFAIKCGVTERH